MATKIGLQLGDITKVKTNAIVNAANSSLLGGSGVDGAVHRAGGPAILEECKLIRQKQGGCKTGEAVITTAGNMPAKKVIHTVGPVWQGGRNGERELLASCYSNSLKLAVENNITRIAFPNISTGVYNYPKKEAATVAIKSVSQFISINQGEIDEVIFVCYDEENFNYHQQILAAEKI